MGMTKTTNLFKTLKETDDIDLKYAVDTLEGMYLAACNGRVSPSDVEKRLDDWDILKCVRKEYKEDFDFLIHSTKMIAFQNS